MVVRMLHKIRNRNIKERCGNKVSLLGRMDRCTLSWYAHMERSTKRNYRAEGDLVSEGGEEWTKRMYGERMW